MTGREEKRENQKAKEKEEVTEEVSARTTPPTLFPPFSFSLTHSPVALLLPLSIDTKNGRIHLVYKWRWCLSVCEGAYTGGMGRGVARLPRASDSIRFPLLLFRGLPVPS